jgi:hypothetical protein
MRRKSIKGYVKNWPEIAHGVKEAARWKCVRCGHEHDIESGHVLTVHHLDLNPSNNEWWNIPPLCQRCHLSIQGRVVMEQVYMLEHSEWFRPYAAGYYASINKYPTDKKWVMEHLDFLLDIGWGLKRG